MFLPTILLLGSLAATVAFVGLAISTSRRYLWGAVVTSWIGSFLGSFSIGLLTLVATFVLLALALADLFGWLTNGVRAAIAVACGVVAWWILVRYVDDYWLFFPIHWILGPLFG